MNLESRIRKKTILSVLLLVSSLSLFAPTAAAAASSGNQTSGFALKATLLRTTTLDSNTAASTTQITSTQDVQPNQDTARGLIPGKVSALTDSSGGASPLKAAPLTTPVVQGFDVQGHSDDTKTVNGLNAYDLSSTHLGFSVEPPDQMLCANGKFVMEGVNDNVRVYTSSLKPASGVQTIEAFFGLPVPDFFFSLSDPKCIFDAGSGHWFVTVTFPFSVPSFILIAVSATTSPLGSWNVYAIDTTDDGSDGTPNNPGCPCLGDQPLLGSNGDAVFISTNEFSQFGPGFNGANMYVLDKAALAAGALSVNAELLTLGLSLPTPDGPCSTGTCWYTVQPAFSPSSQNDNNQGWNDDNHGGTEYALSALQFGDGPYLTTDNRIAVWAFTNTQSISGSPNVLAQVTVIGSEAYTNPLVFATQKAGPTPRGDFCKFGPAAAKPCADGIVHNLPTVPLPGPIQPNDDRMNQVVYTDGLLWSGLNTAVQVADDHHVDPALHNGIAYFVVQPSWRHGALRGEIERQGYVAVKGSDVIFPSIGVTSEGQGVMVFTLTGPNFYPSAAYVTIGEHGTGDQVIVAAKGQSPSDGFTEFQFFGTGAFRPRWGDYSAAAGFGGKVYFSTEFIQHPSCSDAAWASDPTCGGTRARSSNWGTSISVLSP